MLKSKGFPRAKIGLLLGSKDQIREAWDRDQRGTKGFPVNTAQLLAALEDRLKGRRPSRIHRLPTPRAATRLSDILPEKVVRQVHEYLYEQPFGDSLKGLESAATDQGALLRIKNTLEAALYVGHIGYEALPTPRGNWLHRQILGLLIVATPAKFTDSEMAEFFNYFCPCGAEHNREAMKKFRWRHSLRSE